MKHIICILSAFLCTLFIFSCQNKSDKDDSVISNYPLSQLTDSINTYVQPLVNEAFPPQDSGMMAIGVYLKQGDNILVDTHYYFSNAQQPLPDGHTVFQMGSVTKTFTAALVARQAINGTMNLSDAAQDYLPTSGTYPILPTTYNGNDVEITMGQLATMNSGLSRNAYKDSVTNMTPYTTAFDYIDTSKLAFKPGSECYLYSNLGFGVLGLTVCAQAYPDSAEYYNLYEPVVVDSLLNYMDMNDTRITLKSEQTRRLAPSYKANGLPAGYNNPGWPMNIAAGGLYSTLHNMKRYGKEMVGEGDYITQQDLDTLLLPRSSVWVDTCELNNPNINAHQAMAWVLNENMVGPNGNKFQRYSKDGAVTGFSTYITCSTPTLDDTSYKAFVVVWVNKFGFHVQPIGPQIMQLAYDLLE